MKKPTDIGMNRTGIGVSPMHARELIEGAKDALPTSTGDEGTLAAVRVLYSKDALPVGTVPPPTSMKGLAKTVLQLIQGEKGGVLLDKLGERLAFERSGVRMYEALMAKFRAGGTWQGGPTIQELKEIHNDELRHFELVRTALVKLGADTTAMVPSADLAGVEAMGIVQVLTDPRTSPAQGLHAILVAELADYEGWALLVELAESLGEAQLANDLRVALVQEQRHVSLVRVWLRSYVMGEGTLELDEIQA
jgi:hypothetical protein